MVARLQKELAPQGIVVAPVALDDPAKAESFLRKKNLDVWSLVDQQHKVAALYGANFIPRSFVIGRDGAWSRRTLISSPRRDRAAQFRTH